MVTKYFDKKDCITCLIIGLAFYLLNRFSLFISDDYFYTFIKGSKFPVDSLGDAVRSQVYDYFHYNGRFIVHVIVQYFCGVLGKGAFDVFNSLCFTFLCLIVLWILRIEFAGFVRGNFILFFVLLIFVSGVAHIYLGNISGSVNYLWTSCIILLFLAFYFQKRKEVKSCVYYVAVFVFAVIAGSFQESFSFGISLAFFFYYCFHLKDFHGIKAVLVVGFWVGTAICVFAPANFVRLDKVGGADFNFMNYLTRFYNLVINSEVFILFALLIIFSYFRYRKQTVNFIKCNVIIILSILFNAGLVVFIAYTGAHQLTCIELFSIILLIKWIFIFYGDVIERESNKITVGCVISLVLFYVPIYKYRYELYCAHEELVRNAYKATDHIVIAPDYCYCCVARDNWLARNFTHQEIYRQFSKEGLSAVITKAKDVKYIRSILPATKSYIAKSCIEKNEVKESVYRVPKDFYYIIRLPSDCDINSMFIHTVSEPTVAGYIKGWMLHQSNLTYNTQRIIDLDYFFDDNYCYVIVYDFPSLRIQDIMIKRM